MNVVWFVWGHIANSGKRKHWNYFQSHLFSKIILHTFDYSCMTTIEGGIIYTPAWPNASKPPWTLKKIYVSKMIRKKISSSTTLSMRIYKLIMTILHVIMYLRLCIHCLK